MTAAYRLLQVRFAWQTSNIIDIEQLSIPSQACTVILGDNGAGKTTLLSLLGCVIAPSSGTIHYQNQKVTNRNSLAFRRRIAALHQRPYLFRGTVLENAALALKLRGIADSVAREMAMQGLRQVGLSALAQRSARTLSGGEAQRVALARCLVTKPETLLLDEPFSHLDRGSVEIIDTVIRAFAANGCTLVFSTHDHQRWPELADHVVVLDAGKIIDKVQG